VRQLPYAITLVLVAPRGPRVIARFGLRSSVWVGCWLGAVGFALLAMIEVDTPYWFVALGIIPIGVGAAVVMPAASQLIVGSVPLAKSGVGSAVNDVTREVGAALGIAALGSIMASRFHSAMEGPAASLPHDVQEIAKESVGQALAVAQQIGGDAGADLAHSAQRAFTDGVTLAFWVAAGIMLVAGYVFGRLMPNSLPNRIIPSTFETPTETEGTATVELDAS
jgi:hypothetical protein